MRIRLLIILLVLSLCWPRPIHSRTVRVAIIPLTFHSEEDLSNLNKPLMSMMVRGLRQQGFKPVPAVDLVSDVQQAPQKEMNDTLARSIGADLGTEFVIYGSLNKIGEQISLDVRMVDVENRRATVPIFITRIGLENLAGAVSDLAREIGIRILKKRKIHNILVTGNQRIETEAIKLVIKSRSGDVFELAKLREDLTAVYKMGYFKDVRIEADETPQGQDVSFVVTEKPTIEKVSIQGTDAISEEDIDAAISTKRYSILQRSTLKSDVERIRSLYKDKGYYGAEVTTKINELEGNKVAVKFDIEEGDKLYIRKITFSGNHSFSDSDLEDVIQTAEKDFLFWLTESGILKREKLETDVDRLAAYYLNQGFVDARVGSPVISHDQKGIYLDFPIVEGQRFKMGSVEVTGEGIEPARALISGLSLGREEYFNREVLAKDLERVSNFYTGQGYAFAEVIPKINKDASRQVVDVAYEVHKGDLVKFQRIDITGNTKTRDKVIRRELHVVEGSLYSKPRLERSVRNLRRLDYFEQVGMDTSKGSAPDKMNLDVIIKEKPTRFVSLGAGFSSADNLFAVAQIAERNLGGRGQKLNFQGQVGSVSNRFSLTFTEPWLFDIPLAATIEAYNWSRDYDEYDKESIGAKIAFSYPVWNYTRAFISYAYDDAEVSGVAEDASTLIKDQEGAIVTSIVSGTLRRDSRDHAFLTTRGSDNSLTIDYAGGVLGGDAAYTKTVLNSSWYFPLFWDFVGFLHGKAGTIDGSSDGIIPIYERFYLGGINSLRAFDSGDVSPRDPKTGDRIGGDKMLLFNAELLFPLAKEQGVRGVVFFDAGNTWLSFREISLSDLKMDVGGGLRWYSPMGPLRLEYGYNLDPEPGEPKSNWQFSMGVFF